MCGPIPAASIDRHTAGMDWEDVEEFRACIRALDQAYLAWALEQRQHAAQAAQSK